MKEIKVELERTKQEILTGLLNNSSFVINTVDSR